MANLYDDEEETEPVPEEGELGEDDPGPEINAFEEPDAL